MAHDFGWAVLVPEHYGHGKDLFFVLINELIGVVIAKRLDAWVLRPWWR